MKLFKYCLFLAAFLGVFLVSFTAEAKIQNGVPILLYHHVSDEETDLPKLTVSKEAFENQIRRLSDAGFAAISADDLIAYMSGQNIALPEKPVVISFDDGYQDNYTNAFPVLKKYGFKAVVFMVGVNIDAPRRLSQSQMREMSAYGIDFGAHSVTHRDLTVLSPAELRQELYESRAKIERVTQTRVRLFSYPYGFYNLPVFAAVKSAGFDGAVTVLSGLTREGYDNIFLMRRVPILYNTDFDALFEKMDSNQAKEGLLDYLPEAFPDE